MQSKNTICKKPVGEITLRATILEKLKDSLSANSFTASLFPKDAFFFWRIKRGKMDIMAENPPRIKYQ